jgi:mono/diheme cytochrome c family protein
VRRASWVTLLALACACTRAREGDPQAMLQFVRDGKPVRTLTLAELRANVPAETVSGYDPYYARAKTFRALPLARVVALGFEGQPGELRAEEYVLRAKDGYAVPMRGALVFEPGGYVAFADAEVPGWEPIGPQRASPAPFYVVWGKPEQASLDTHPRPWALVTVEMARFETVFPHTSPGDLPEDAPARRGYAIFRNRCIECHAMNREGGRVGPDLNVPQNVTEYRPEPQIRAYIRDPRTFRYGNMPPHPDLGDAELDALVAYLRAMKDRKHDAP